MRVLQVPGYVKGLIFDCNGTLVDSMPQDLRIQKFDPADGMTGTNETI